MGSPLISVIMPVHNGGKFLKEAIESILQQTYETFEFIIIDDGSTDTSVDIIKCYNHPSIIFLQQQNSGIAVALNKGIKIAKGKYIARMDADDIALPHRLQTQVDFLERNANCVVVGSNFFAIDINGRFLFESNFETNWVDIKQKVPDIPLAHPTTMYRTQAVRNAGGYLETYKNLFDDNLLWNKMTRFGEIWNIEEPLIKYRIGPWGGSNRTMKTERIIKRILQRIVENNEPTKADEVILGKIMKPRSKSWKWSQYYFRTGCIYLFAQRKRKLAVSHFSISILHYPFNLRTWFNLFLSLSPYFVIQCWSRYRAKEGRSVGKINR